jgi:hypothetical protein
LRRRRFAVLSPSSLSLLDLPKGWFHTQIKVLSHKQNFSHKTSVTKLLSQNFSHNFSLPSFFVASHRAFLGHTFLNARAPPQASRFQMTASPTTTTTTTTIAGGGGPPSDPIVPDEKSETPTLTDATNAKPDNDVAPAPARPAAAGGPPGAPDGSPAPNGGLWAWLQVVGAFMVLFNTWGILNTFGVFQTYYESGALFDESSSNISWIGSLQAFFVLVGGIFSGPIYDRGEL